MITRRDFLKVGTTVLASGLASIKIMPSQAKSIEVASKIYQGSNMAGWLVELGDAIYAAPGEPPVENADIKTVHRVGYSETRANVLRRVIMAHNITFKRITDPIAFNYIHTCSFSFRLPYLPMMDPNATLNGQTLECGIFIWDGLNKKRDYGMAFQWIVNPWGDGKIPAGTLRVWTGKGWMRVGRLPLDNKWHTAQMVVDFKRKGTLLLIDNKYQLSRYSITIKEPDFSWSNTVDARFQVEAISIDPRPDNTIKAMHRVQFKDWKWLWETASC